MYRTCIFCSADLGGNEAVAEFPVGKALAFDAWKGRLWAVCPRCTRWNLAPIEERWEAMESAEKQFADARLRVQSENIGLAKLRDGTRLIRVGQALPGELAAWRYGEELVGRRRRYLAITAAAIAVPVVAIGGLWAVGAAGVFGAAINFGTMLWERHKSHRVVQSIGPAGRELLLRRYHLAGLRTRKDDQGSIALELPNGLISKPSESASTPLVLHGDNARMVLGKAMVLANSSGANRNRVSEAVGLLAAAGDAATYLRNIAAMQVRILSASQWNRRADLPDLRNDWHRFAGTFRNEPMPYVEQPANPNAWNDWKASLPRWRLPGARRRKSRTLPTTSRMSRQNEGHRRLTMQAYRVETTLTQNGELRLAQLPFRAGARVEVIVLAHEEQAGTSERYPLRGTPYRYDDPFEPVAVDDWEAPQ